MILAAGLGTRLRPWTLKHPKALVPVKGVPMIKRVIDRMKKADVDTVCVNIHHFGDQIITYLKENDPGVDWIISDERSGLLDTGGGLLQACGILFEKDDDPFLVHNVDILSNADLIQLMKSHEKSGNDITLLTSGRASSRKLIIGKDSRLRGWHNTSTGEYRPEGFVSEEGDREVAFSGIYVMGKGAYEHLNRYAEDRHTNVFPVMDFFLDNIDKVKIGEYYSEDLQLIDIGKPATLDKANEAGIDLLNDEFNGE